MTRMALSLPPPGAMATTILTVPEGWYSPFSSMSSPCPWPPWVQPARSRAPVAIAAMHRARDLIVVPFRWRSFGADRRAIATVGPTGSRPMSCAGALRCLRSQADRGSQRAPARAEVGLVHADDLVGRPVRRGGDRYRQPALHGHAVVEAHQIESDLSLVVIHSDHAVELPVTRSDDQGVARKRNCDP